MPANVPRQLRTTEAQFQTWVSRIARQAGWMVYHTKLSWGSTKGFPDLVLLRAGRLIFAELKSDHGCASPEQERWLAELRATGAEVYLWRPAQVEDVFRCLTARIGVTS